MAEENFILGMNGKLYFSTTLMSSTTPPVSPTLIGNVTDVNVNLSTGEADITTRSNGGWRATVPTLREMTIDFEMQWKPGDEAFEAIKDAYLANGEICIVCLDKTIATAGAQGPAGNFVVTNFARSEPLEEAMKVSVTLKASSYMTWHEVSGT